MKMRMIAAMLLTTVISLGVNKSAKAQPGYGYGGNGYRGNGHHYGWNNRGACGPRVVYAPRRVYRRPVCAPVYAAPVYAPAPVCAPPAPVYYSAPPPPCGPRVQFSIGAAW